MTYEERIKRRDLIVEGKKKGRTFEEMGRSLKISRVRVHQIFHHKPEKDIVPNPLWRKFSLWQKTGRGRTRMLVRSRDNFTCQECRKKWKHGDRQFDVHHLNGLCGKKSKGYDSVSDLTGMITLCHKCHFNHPEHTWHIK